LILILIFENKYEEFKRRSSSGVSIFITDKSLMDKRAKMIIIILVIKECIILKNTKQNTRNLSYIKIR